MNKIPDTVIERMVDYYCLIKRIDDGSLDKVISSEELASKTGVSAVTIRKDLSYFGKFGCKGVGYNIAELKKQLKKSLYIGNNNF